MEKLNYQLLEWQKELTDVLPAVELLKNAGAEFKVVRNNEGKYAVMTSGEKIQEGAKGGKYDFPINEKRDILEVV